MKYANFVRDVTITMLNEGSPKCRSVLLCCSNVRSSWTRKEVDGFPCDSG